jgi:hypothetical protein
MVVRSNHGSQLSKRELNLKDRFQEARAAGSNNPKHGLYYGSKRVESKIVQKEKVHDVVHKKEG